MPWYTELFPTPFTPSIMAEQGFSSSGEYLKDTP
ncbi:hypothetical protein BACCAC_01582 [Bacteroides caccae ATCC 43185]|nr:hypothetical protein BACCAC_01582 [Bacteroides caccae ATCC 43185]